MTHLDVRRWHDLLHGDLPVDEAARLRAHLAAGCDTCEELLVELGAAGEVDALDGAVDEALLELDASLQSAPFDELGFARVLRASARARRAPWLGAAAVALAAAGVVLWVGLRPGPDATWRSKGGAPMSMALGLEVLQREGTVLTLLREGAQVERGATLVFRVQLDRPACVHLDVDDAALLGAPLCLPAGAHTLARDGVALGWIVEREGTLTLRARAEARDPAATAEVRLRLIAGVPASAERP